MLKKYFPLFLLLAVILNACKKDDSEPVGPIIKFKVGTAYTQNDAIVQVGHKLIFGIEATSGDEVITNFTIKKTLEDGKIVTMMDTGVYAKNLDITKVFYQNVENKATWTFTVMDKNRLSAKIQMIVYKDPNSTYGGIFYFPSVTLGYQNNTQFGHFLNPSTGKVYFEDSATVYYKGIDILCYYIISENQPSPVLSSAGEMDNYSVEAKTFYPSIISWPSRNYTLWDISVDNTPISSADFNAAQNDSLLIVSYNDVWGKKKFKWATTGKIIPFKTNAGKLGLIKVINAETNESGTIEIAIKIQQ